MTLLLPLGLLALIGIGVLILIYIIKPNYLQKVISSTFVWKLSLRYRKKRIPVNRINNILIFLCQLLVLSICALLIARPVIPFEVLTDKNEKIVIIDASASMLVSNGEETRFERAVSGVKDFAEITASDDGALTVIVASDKAYYLVQRSNASSLEEVIEKCDSLVNDGLKCSYGSADMTGAVALAEDILEENSEAEVILYTATDYTETSGITIVPMAEEGEWNAAVLNVTAALNDNNHYEISVDLGCFGLTESVNVYCDIYGANDNDKAVTSLYKTEFFDNTEEQKTITFTTDDLNGVPLYSFRYLHVYIEESDSFADDNSYYLYGGKKEAINIQYASSTPNNFWSGALKTMRESMKLSWDIKLTELKAGERGATEGFDLYIYEGNMPSVLPTDGIVLMIAPYNGAAPEGSGISFDKWVQIDSSSTLASGASHEITKYVNPDHITIARYRKMSFDASYQELMYYAGDPVMLVKNESNSKIVVMAFDLNYSNLSAVLDYPIMLYNMFNYFIPSTFTETAYEIGDTVTLNARGTELSISGPDAITVNFDKLPGELVVTRPGSYTSTQKSMRENTYIVENFFVKIPNYESQITKVVDSLPIVEIDQTLEQANQDLLVYLAAAMVAILFIEWLLQSREHF